MRVLFWGTPEFGLPSLEAMRAAGHEIAGIVTNPDRPAGRGRRLRASPVKVWALEAGVPVLQPARPGDEEFLAAARRLRPDISVVAAYGRLLPRAALDLPPLGSLNVHASLLPELRGAAPINWAIIRGHRESGISIQRMVVELDAGPVLGQTRIPISATMTAGELYREAAEAGGARLVAVLDDLASGRSVETPQDDARATWAPKLDREAARIDWSRPAAEVANRLRGCDPWPAAWTPLAAPAGLAGTRVQCFEPGVGDAGADDAGAGSAHSGVSPGSVVEADPARGLRVATGSGAIAIGAVKPAGRRRMSAAEWVRGLQDPKEVRFG
ncbi:methionyl-tRNA formyltransferase [Candidatus Palauibacter sp.]|uniref:methionyl-tRNA formyltransferase n=1 Tax=Candidatus Palauibacter sp. TaxID=3101350 RepID=UPI003B5233EF